MELVCTNARPRVQHLRKHGSMDSLCGISYFLLIQIKQGQKGDGLCLCHHCERLENEIIEKAK
jgi:hypothetical protein